MADLSNEEKKLFSKVENKLKNQLSDSSIINTDNSSDQEQETKEVVSKDYDEFKKENLPQGFGWFEKACKFSESIMKAEPEKELLAKLRESIYTCHLNVTPQSATSFVYVGAIAAFLVCLVLGMLFYVLFMLSPNTAHKSMDILTFFIFIGVILAMMAYFQIRNMPMNLANQWRMKASNQMIICTFYIVTFMRHSSNLENAIRFAAEHVGYPLSVDLKRVIWDVETQKYASITESLDNYLAGWKDYAPEFVESMNLISSSLLQGSEERRLGTLDKSLSNILDQTYEKMLHYAHNLQGPLSNLNMLGIILPVLSMVILPLVISMMAVDWYYLAGLYNIILFISVFNMSNKILSTRPSGYGNTDVGDSADKFKMLKVNLGFTVLEIKPSTAAISVGVIFFMLALSPLIIHNLNPMFDEEMSYYLIDFLGEAYGQNLKLIDFREKNGIETGPFGLLGTIMSFCFTLAFGLSLSTYYKSKSSDVIKIREKTKKLEEEFTGSLFQLGNRLEDGYPTEIAIAKVGQTLDGTVSGEFFKQASDNIQRLGMNVGDAIFNKENGAIRSFPSALIASTMKVLVESAKKGPKIAAQAMINVSTYIKEMHKVDERLKDLMSETIASMKSQIKMLTPLISAIVVGITSLIINILGTIGSQTEKLSAGAGGMGGMTSMFGEGIPTYYFQIVVGLYVVQIIFLLTRLVSGMENGSDKLTQDYLLGQNLSKSTMLYVFVAFSAVVGFTFLALMILGEGGLM